MKFNVVKKYGVLVLFFCGCVTGLIIPEELPTILSLIYSNIPPIKKGTDSRVGVGFRLGEHADFQVLVELGPQRETDPIGLAATKRRRQATLSAAMKGELGPWAQSVAKYQMQLRIQKELEEQAKLQEKLKKLQTKEVQKDGEAADEWLTKWSKGMVEPPGEESPVENLPIQEILPSMMMAGNRISTRKSPQTLANNDMNNKLRELQKLYKPQ